MKRVRRPADFFLRAGAGRRISGAAKRTKLRLPVDKSGHRWYDIPRERGGSSIHAGDGADIH